MSFKNELTTNELLIVKSEMAKSEKTMAMAYLLLFIGFLGLHRFYLGYVTIGILQLCIWIFFWIAYISLEIGLVIESLPLIIGSIIIMAVSGISELIWLIVDACRMKGFVTLYNKKIEDQVIDSIIRFRQ